MAREPSDGSKSPRVNVKRFLNKLLMPKHKLKKEKPEENLVVDSLPEYFQEDTEDIEHEKVEQELKGSSTRDHLERENGDIKSQSKSKGKEERFPCEGGVEEEKEDNNTESGENKQDKKFSYQSSQQKKSSNQGTYITNNMTVSNSTVQIGNTYNYVQNQVVNVVKSEPQKVEKSKDVEELISCKTKLGFDHIEFLSNHFGQSWKPIGIKLGLTSGQLDIISEYECEIKKMSFKILDLWRKNNVDKATVGRLCDLLWKSKIASAREAVCRLAANWRKFN